MKMKNSALLDAFMNGTGIDNENHSGNLMVDKNNMLLNYGHIIALFYEGNLVLNITNYSPTTSKHQNYIFNNFPKDKIIEVTKNEMIDYAQKVIEEYWSRA